MTFLIVWFTLGLFVYFQSLPIVFHKRQKYSLELILGMFVFSILVPPIVAIVNYSTMINYLKKLDEFQNQ